MKILDNMIVILSNYLDQIKTLEKIVKKTKELEDRIAHLESVANNFDEEIEIHKNNIEKLYEINIKILSAIKPKKNTQQNTFNEAKNKEHIN